MRFAWALSMLALVCLSGCASGRLRQRTINQGCTLPELQYQQVLGNLAQFARNPGVLPWHVNLKEGTTQITDSVSGGGDAETSGRRSRGSRNCSDRGPGWPSGVCPR